MAAVRTDDTLPRGGLSHIPRAPLTLHGWSLGAGMRTPVQDGAALNGQLQVLALLRGISTLSLLAITWALNALFGMVIPMGLLLAALGFQLVSEAVLLLRIGSRRPVSESEFFAHLLLDVVWLTAVLYLLGGSKHNPFADFYFVYVGLAALTLSGRYAGLTLVIAVAAYQTLLTHFVPLQFEHLSWAPEDADALAHAAQFMMISMIVAYLGYRLSAVAASHADLTAKSRLTQARNEAAVNLASLAAGAAHEMGTPLMTMAVLVGEMQRGRISPEDMQGSLDRLDDAIKACKRSLQDIVQAVGVEDLPERMKQPGGLFLRETIERFRPMRPGVRVTLNDHCTGACMLMVDATLRQSLLSLIANAADVSPDGVQVALRCESGEAQIDIIDHGPGIPPAIRDKLGKILITTKKASGNGLGVFLANLNFSRMGGRMEFIARQGGGTCVRIHLPMNEK